MTLARKAALAVTAGLLLTPAPAFAAAGTTTGHANGHHSGHHAKHHRGAPVAKSHLAHQIRSVRSQVGKLHSQVASAGLSNHQQQVLENRLFARDDISALRHQLGHAHGTKALHRLSASIHRVDVLVSHQKNVVHFLVQVDGSLGHWRKLDRRLQAVGQCIQESEEAPEVMARFDTAVADLDAVQETLSGDVDLLLAASGKGDDALRSATSHVLRDLNRVADDISAAVSALESLESQFS